MQIQLIAVGTRMPPWIKTGFDDYSSRLPRECGLYLKEIPAAKRSKNMAANRILQQEGERILEAVPAGTRIIALDIKGQQWNTKQLAVQLDNWLLDGRNVALLVGGPEGLADECRRRAEQIWSLSALTFPHALVRVLVAEQLYRAWSILKGLPYHRP